MRTALLAALAIALSAPAGAQSRGGRSHQSAHQSADATAEVFHPSIGLPLPPIGLPLPPIGLPPAQMTTPPRDVTSPPRVPQPSSRRRGRTAGAVFLYWPEFGWPASYLPGTAMPSPPSPPPAPAPQDVIGRLRLELQSGIDPQIYVDDYFVGLLSDAGGSELSLEAGTHVVELREQGYETLHLDVQIAPDRVATYRGELKSLSFAPQMSQPAAPAPPPPPATTIYVIPGCYVGNVPPRDASLPEGCDPASAVEFPPARSR